ncbi:MAG TPA: BatD family protein [Mucilaginibacter sp.]|jgi:hypothetical protein|nr:BatD family protein [Mucilaginibacter sp.]
MKIKYLILTLLLFVATNALAQQPKFTASVSKSTVGTGEVFEVTFSVSGNGGNFTPPDFSGFQVAGGPNESQSMEIINGNTSASISIGYDLVAIKEGQFTIGAATIEVNGHKLTSTPIKITVVKGKPVPQNAPAQAQSSAPDNGIQQASAADLSKLLFIKAIVDKTNVYLGQQITVTYRLYTRVGIVQNQAASTPELNGFWSEDIKQQSGQIPMHIEVYKGVRYEVADLKKTILFPERSGDLTVDPLGMTFIVSVPVQSSDPFAQFFQDTRQEKYVAKSAPVAIHVKPLPEAGKPASFTGAVGSFSIESSVDKAELKANDALNYRVKVTGSGNIKLLKTLAANFPADFEKYDPKITDTVNENENGVSGSRFYNYLLIPRHQGDYNIDPLQFSYFNPVTNRYVTLSTKGFHIKVDKGANESNVTAFADAEKQDIKMLSKDIRYIKTEDNNLVKNGDTFFGSFGYWLLLLLGPTLAYGAYIYRNKLVEQNSDLVKVKSRKAGKIAAKHLANAQKQLAAGNAAVFYENVFTGLYGYLSDKLNIQYADLNKETIVAALKGNKVSDQLTGRLMNTLDLCEMARYAPVTHISQQEVFEKAKGIINDIENEI